VTDSDFAGRYMLVYFGYSSCPDICPAVLQVMGAALDRLESSGDAIVPVFITVDPERDSAAVLRRFAARYHPRLVALTGTPEDIAQVARAYRVPPGVIGGENTGTGVPAHHSTIIYLMGPDGKFIRHFTYTTDAGWLADELSKSVSR
jgi:protein SCO1/2